MLRLPSLALAAAMALLPQAASAAEFEGASLSLLWALPFAGILLSIALLPLVAHHAWEHHQGKIAALWGLLVIVPMAIAFGPTAAVHALAHTAFLEYIPFILLLLALFTVAGGILVRGNIHGSPGTNTVLLAIDMPGDGSFCNDSGAGAGRSSVVFTSVTSAAGSNGLERKGRLPFRMP